MEQYANKFFRFHLDWIEALAEELKSTNDSAFIESRINTLRLYWALVNRAKKSLNKQAVVNMLPQIIAMEYDINSYEVNV